MGEIRWVAFDFAPRGWAKCDGQTLAINQNQALFSLLGTSFGGNGMTTFGLPDLRGRTPIHVGNGYTLGQKVGAETHTLQINELPAHTHFIQIDPKEATTATPGSSLSLAKSSSGTSAYGVSITSTMSSQTLAIVGGSQAHSNMKPYLALTCLIALQGVFPSRN